MNTFLFLLFFSSIFLNYASGGNRRSSEAGPASEELSLATEVPLEVAKMDKSLCVCRLGSSRRIVGGEEAEVHLIPWQVSLARSYDGEHFCGATIINRNYILTAAHCVKNKNKFSIDVRVGMHQINDPNLDDKTYYVKEIIIYPSDTGDMAILWLEDPIDFIPGQVEPACLNFIKKKYTGQLMISGWGITAPVRENSTTKELDPSPLSPVLKIAYLNPLKKKGKKNFIYANSDQENSLCFGDSGGPLHYTENGRTAVEGISLKTKGIYLDSGDKLYCLGERPDYFVKLSYKKYKKWFEKIIGDDYCTL